MEIKRIAVLTSGGDCCGLNAVIESVVLSATQRGAEVIGFINGYDGLYNNEYMVLTPQLVKTIGSVGGSIIGNSNKTNLFNHRVLVNGEWIYRDDSAVAKKNLEEDKVDVIVIVGGDGSMTSARDLKRMGVNVVCVPKTIDNDVPYTDQTFGYQTAVAKIADALESVRTTGLAHERVMLVEVMGRHAGWLALEGGIAGDADMILLPEVEFDTEKVAAKLIERYNSGKKSTVICVSEGATQKGAGVTSYQNVKFPDSVKLGGIGAKLAYELQKMLEDKTDQEVKSTQLAYIQRGGYTNAFDKVLSYRYGSYAVDAMFEGKFGCMVSLNGQKLSTVPLEEIVGNGPTGETSKGGSKNVTPDSDLYRCAKSMGIYFGD